MKPIPKISVFAFILFAAWISTASVWKADGFKVIDFDEFESITKTPSEKIRMFNFWATWCAPCVKEMPDFEKVNAQDPEVELMFISLDDGNKTQRVQEFIQKRGIKAPVFLLDDVDYNKWIDKVSSNWSGAIPATLFISADGTRFFHEGELNEKQLKYLIKKIKQGHNEK
ncbi:hypothetical protein P872_00910 [Rhodonellum psychrophilum GCM71 = DSM 17998]|uniref:Thioredoxin domain-containing protein n=2 Tax=Rhodonellum TaxID=336827 RepID=U5C7B1_9BACT|nr:MULTISPECIES: TlpA disulfide reductase family protein [Rhodonellum]ERM84102.1 hypothetical protein P872_00910 [Rhodonellum psychrophilum GCM71 = DSM 17998]MDO9552680.1 TlpA disulfide reductase family protein [Rhodonellum sp.]SDY41966.1 Thiol-disulfide isomerase or thioredoxin [Rhodonellum ikkaensis]